jgi:hypothetical protein
MVLILVLCPLVVFRAVSGGHQPGDPSRHAFRVMGCSGARTSATKNAPVKYSGCLGRAKQTIVVFGLAWSPQSSAWLLQRSGIHQRASPLDCGVQRIKAAEYLSWKAPSGLVKVWSALCAYSAIDSPQKHRQKMAFITGSTPSHSRSDARDGPDANVRRAERFPFGPPFERGRPDTVWSD